MSTTIERQTTDELWKLVRDAAFAFLRDDFAGRVAECNLTMSQGKLVRELAVPASQRELARRLHYDPSNITALADSLEARGLLERRADRADRRFRRLALTKAGEKLRLALEDRLAKPPAFIDRLTPAEQTRLLELLSKLFETRSVSRGRA